MTSPILNGLIKKRSEISGRIHAAHAEAARLVAALDHLDCVIRLFNPEIDFQDIPVKALPPPNAAFRGEFQWSLLEMLRGQQRWLTTDDLCVKVMVHAPNVIRVRP